MGRTKIRKVARTVNSLLQHKQMCGHGDKTASSKLNVARILDITQNKIRHQQTPQSRKRNLRQREVYTKTEEIKDATFSFYVSI